MKKWILLGALVGVAAGCLLLVLLAEYEDDQY
jgi:hypothetical protein